MGHQRARFKDDRAFQVELEFRNAKISFRLVYFFTQLNAPGRSGVKRRPWYGSKSNHNNRTKVDLFNFC